MHDNGHKMQLQKSPCVQIMFNINSKNYVNNNIIGDIQKPFHLDLNPNDVSNKNDKTIILSNKKHSINSNQKSNKTNLNKTYSNNPKAADFNSQQNSKSNKKNIKINKANLSINQTLKSTKHTNFNKNISGTFTKTNLYQEINLISQKKVKKSKQNIQKNKLMRQKIIQLMIKDYQNGKISANNLKIAISSLIDKQTNDNKSKSKPYSKTQKSRVNLPSSYKSSLTNSFRNIPKNIPTKSKSQKMYQHSFIKFGKRIEQFDQQPQIIQRVIDRKDFASKIVIKGINSSLFLSNQWTTNDSPQKESVVNVNVINTSDSVKDLRKEMQKLSIKNVEKNKDQSRVMNAKNYELFDSQNNEETKNILNYYISEIQNQHDKRKNPQFYQNFYTQKEFTKMQRQMYLNSLNSQENNDDNQDLQNQSLQQYELRQPSSIDGEVKLEQDQKQPFNIDQKSYNKQHMNQCDQEQIQKSQNSQKIKSYLSSQLENNQKKFTFSTSKKQELSQKRVRSITQNEIKRLNQVLDVINQQLKIQSKPTQKQINQQQVLLNLMSLIQKQKNKASQELKLYNLFNDKKDSLSQKNQNENGEKIDHNQIINSFKKKLNKKTFNVAQTNTNQKPFNKVYFESQGIKSNKSQKSFSSISSNNHLQKTKISQLNFDQIQSGLYKRLHDIQFKKQKQISIITQKFINDKISPKEYHQEKQIIQKWFLVESNKLKKTKKYLLQGYKKAKNYLLKDQVSYETNLTREKSNKMIKCISEKYLSKKQVLDEENQDILKHSDLQIQKYPDKYVTIDIEEMDSKRRNVVKTILKSEQKNFLSGQSDDQQQKDIISPQSLQEEGNFSQNEQQQHQEETINKNKEQILAIQEQEQNDNVYIDDLEYMQQIELIQPFRNEISSYLQRYDNQNQLQDCQYEIYDGQQLVEDQIIHQGQQDDYQNQMKSSKFFIQNQSTINQQNLLSIQQTQQKLNIIMNKRPNQIQNQQLFSPKKIKHHQNQNQHQQFSQQLTQYHSLSSNKNQTSLTFQKINTRFSPKNIKFKYLTEEDKDDIFQFLFLDLCLEIFLDQSKNSRITKSIQKYITYLRKKKTIPKGFKTGLQICKTYVNHLESYLLSNYFTILKRLQSPIGPSAKQMLKFMRQYEEIQQSNCSQSDTVGLVLPIQVYQKFQLQPINILEVQRYYDDDERQTGRIKFLTSLKRFHSKALFDSLNQMLDLQRNFGVWGKPFPWKKTLSIDRKLSDSQLKQKLKKSSQKVIENCSYLCGVMLDKQDSVFGKAKISQEYLHHIREDRMSKMLSNDMLDNQERWIFYDDEEVEVLVSISKSVISSLVNEAVQDIETIISRQIT